MAEMERLFLSQQEVLKVSVKVSGCVSWNR